ncbi:aminotransferase [Candidatus Saccharibacteria bacterium]|nr:MAG: aminotransferase [Candidatus Saccharibacteria bacterium]
MTDKKTVYLDYAAATPLDERVFVAMKPFFSDNFYNPSSPYLAAKRVKTALREAKETIGRVIGAKESEIILTAGATESVNMAIWGTLNHFEGGHVVTTAIEHPAVLQAIKRHPYTIVPVQQNGLVDSSAIKAAITDETVLITVGLVNNELGAVQPLREIAQLVAVQRQQRLQRDIGLPLLLHSDASQAAGLLDINTARLGVDLLTLNAAKCYGPKQTGLLWVKSGVQLSPLIVGGGQEGNLRSGTQSVPNAVGFAVALEHADARRKHYSEELRRLRDYLQEIVTKSIPETIVNGPIKRRAPNFLHLAWPNVDAERVLFSLDERGIMVATGSACAANKGTRSHVLTAIGMAPEIADGSIRITLGKYTTKEEIEYAARTIIEVVQKELQR